MRGIEELANLLFEMSELESHVFKSRAYSRASVVIKNITEEEFLTMDSFRDYEGIGLGINSKILEYRETGSINKLTELRDETRSYLDPVIYKIRKSFTTKRVPRKDATVLSELIISRLESLGVDGIEVTGSYRRNAARIGDLDLMIPRKHYLKVVEYLSKSYDILTEGSYKASFMIDKINNLPLEICSYSEEVGEFPAALMYLTGSKSFNIRTRALAKSKGLLLNQYGLFDENKDNLLTSNREEEIFEVLGIDYVKPEDR